MIAPDLRNERFPLYVLGTAFPDVPEGAAVVDLQAFGFMPAAGASQVCHAEPFALTGLAWDPVTANPILSAFGQNGTKFVGRVLAWGCGVECAAAAPPTEFKATWKVERIPQAPDGTDGTAVTITRADTYAQTQDRRPMQPIARGQWPDLRILRPPPANRALLMLENLDALRVTAFQEAGGLIPVGTAVRARLLLALWAVE